MARRLGSEDVLDRLTQLFTQRGAPYHLRSDNDSELTAQKVREWLSQLNVKTLYIEPGSPWENGYIESLNGKLRDELLDSNMKAVLPPGKLQEAWQSFIAQVGPFKRQVSVRAEKSPPYDAVFVTCQFEKATVDVNVTFNNAGKIAGLLVGQG